MGWLTETVTSNAKEARGDHLMFPLIVHEVKFFSSNSCHTGCGIKEMSIRGSDPLLIISDSPGSAKVSFLYRQKVNHHISGWFYMLSLHIYVAAGLNQTFKRWICEHLVEL